MPNVILKCSGTDGTAMTLSQGPDTNMDLAGTFEINPLQLYFLDGQGYMECSHASRFFLQKSTRALSVIRRRQKNKYMLVCVPRYTSWC